MQGSVSALVKRILLAVEEEFSLACVRLSRLGCHYFPHVYAFLPF